MDYKERLKISLTGDSKTNFYTFNGLLLATGYVRIVIGKRGPYIEFLENNIHLKNMHVPQKEKYRLNSPLVYYNEYRSNDDSNVKIYHQKREVDYADYKINFWYISPFELKTDDVDRIIIPMKKNTLIRDVTKRLNEEYLKNPIDEIQQKRNRDWSILGSQVFGAEKY